MRFKKPVFLGLSCLVMLAVAAPALAANPAQNAYGKFSQFSGPGAQLPFTGISVGAVVAIGALLLVAGLAVRLTTRARLSD